MRDHFRAIDSGYRMDVRDAFFFDEERFEKGQKFVTLKELTYDSIPSGCRLIKQLFWENSVRDGTMESSETAETKRQETLTEEDIQETLTAKLDDPSFVESLKAIHPWFERHTCTGATVLQSEGTHQLVSTRDSERQGKSKVWKYNLLTRFFHVDFTPESLDRARKKAKFNETSGVVLNFWVNASSGEPPLKESLVLVSRFDKKLLVEPKKILFKGPCLTIDKSLNKGVDEELFTHLNEGVGNELLSWRSFSLILSRASEVNVMVEPHWTQLLKEVSSFEKNYKPNESEKEQIIEVVSKTAFVVRLIQKGVDEETLRRRFNHILNRINQIVWKVDEKDVTYVFGQREKLLQLKNLLNTGTIYDKGPQIEEEHKVLVLKYDPNLAYHFAPCMQRGDTIVFDSTSVPHRVATFDTLTTPGEKTTASPRLSFDFRVFFSESVKEE